MRAFASFQRSKSTLNNNNKKTHIFEFHVVELKNRHNFSLLCYTAVTKHLLFSFFI